MRREFPAKIKLAAFERSGGNCEVCTAKLFPGNVEYDHQIPCALGGDAILENCIVTCRTCHRNKTGKTDIPAIAKSVRVRKRNAGIKKPRTIRAWRKFNRQAVYASRER